jgi:pimeloyl-ACP methyl ester carboxylesterase
MAAMNNAAFDLPGMHVSNRNFTVPLDHAAPQGDTITVFAREVVASDKQDQDLPWLVFFQGGPGGAAPRPDTRSGWLKRALQDYRVLLLDQRGTGLSSPVTFQTLAHFGSPAEQAAYLTHFRSDSIVADAELIRQQLTAGRQWSVLGQSFGGFCVLHYLSAAPQALREAFITGGIPSLDRPAEDVYRATYPRVEQKNREFFERYPAAQRQCRRIAGHLLEVDERLPNGQRFTVEQFQQLGLALGASDGFERINYLLEGAFVEQGSAQDSAQADQQAGERIAGQALSYEFLFAMLNEINFHTRPIFTVLHEAIYCQGDASRWAAQRVRGEFPQFNFEPGNEFLFTGEMVYPWMLEQYETLRPLREAAELLAQKDDWPRLYDPEVLARNTVPVAAALYYFDMYVDLGYSLETVARIPHVKPWITSEYEHNGLRADGERILDRLIGLAKLA